ncbi:MULTISPECIES: hypothetical protein [unclassified Leifsonia]|uniref:hypothetical protein n=1 Tax=unclassified Leifsonia TaxID=2663824 RepID=UPI0006FB2903|nr:MULTISPECIES: hypothetical protein [unclassified Leifsonia]KQX06567.1 hypothetical protein ASC59_01515 [Leifsonia sp. Root1293]KRA10851.1 hypothetical protein ASD61_01515 [Leifsonia sp. Root60]
MSNGGTDARGRLESDPFDYRVTSGGQVLVARGGRTVLTVSGASAARLVTTLASADERSTQLLLAKATGNYKRGNERR